MHNFKRTALTLAALLLALILVFSIYTAPYYYGTAYYYQDAGVRDALSGQLDTLICGSSHAFRAFVPAIMDENMGTCSYNLGCAMLTMEGRYYLLKKELSRNPVKTVIMEVSYNALTRNRKSEGPEGDLYEMGRFSNPLERLNFMFHAFPVSEYGKLYYDTMDRSTTAWKKLFAGTMGLQTVQGYLGAETRDQTIPESDWPGMYLASGVSEKKDPEGVRIFEQCLDLCREQGVEVILVVTPMADRSILGYSGLDTVLGWYREYAREYQCTLLDFNLLKTRMDDYPQDTAFHDRTHLSFSGAETFTNDLCRVLELVRTGEDVQDMFYANYAELTQVLADRMNLTY